MNRVLFGLALAIYRAALFLRVIAGIVIHTFTIWFAYKVAGFMGAVLSFAFPFAAQMYWAWRAWSETGVLFNLFTIAIIGFIWLWLLSIVASVLVAVEAEK